MKALLPFLACLALAFALGCEDRSDRHAPTTDSAPPPVREEGPAERTGRIVDEATKQAAEAVGKGLEKAGKEIRANVPEPEYRPPPPSDERER